MIKHTAAAMAFAVGVSALGAAHAQPAKPAPVAVQSAARTMQSWVAGVSGWMLQFQQNETAIGTLMRSVADDSETAGAFISRGDSKGGAAWAADWAATRRRQANDIRASVLGLSTAPPPAPALLAADPRMRRYEAALRSDGQALRDLLLQDLDLTNDVIDLIERTALGDPDAAGQLAVKLIDTSVALIGSENSMMQSELDHAAILGQNSADPEADLLRAIIKSNEAMIALINELKAEDQGAPVAGDPITRARQAIDASKAAARQAPADAARMLALLRSDKPLASAELVRRTQLATETFAESADIEVAIDDKLLAVIDGMGAGTRIDPVRLSAALEEVDKLSQRRVALDQRRKQDMAGQSQ